MRTQTTGLTSRTNLGVTNISNTSATTLNVTEMRSVNGGAIRLEQTGGGDAVIGSVITGALSSSGLPHITLLNNAGSLRLNGQVSAGGSGSIKLQTQQNLVLGNTSRLITNSQNALIEANAAGQIQFLPGAVVRAGAGTASTEAVMTQIPPLVQVIAVINSIGLNVDTDGVGVIDILLSPSGIGVLDQNYDLTIDWGGGAIDRLPLGPKDVNTRDPGIPRFDASLTPYRISHQYLQNPNANDPTADIAVRVKAQVDSLNRIRFTDSTGIDQRLSASSDTLLLVPSTGLVSLFFVLPQTPTIQKQLAFARDNTDVSVPRTVTSERSDLPVNTFTTSSVQQQRKIILRVMVPVDAFGTVEALGGAQNDIPLTPEDLADLEALFQRLSDNRYRIYIILEDGNEILLKDILLRNHQPVEIEDALNIREIDRSNIPPLDELSPTDKNSSTQSTVTPLSWLPDQPTVERDIERLDSAASTESFMFRSWRKAARRFRAG